MIALHNLCNLIRKCGHESYIWPAGLPVPASESKRRYTPKFLQRRLVPNIQFRTNPYFDTPIASPQDLPGAIAIYPEVVSGNPLGSDKIVRWFLNKPGKLTGQVNFTENELFFFFQEGFNDPSINPNLENKLQIVMLLDNVFKQTKPIEGRKGTCYILRKGKSRAPSPNELDGPVIDNRSHEEIAEIFNAHEYCVSYDTHTMYSAYAVMCGCKSIIVPEPGVTKEQWQPDQEFAYGLAYGREELNWAAQTRPLLFECYKKIQEENIKSVRNFIGKVEKHFRFNGD